MGNALETKFEQMGARLKVSPNANVIDEYLGDLHECAEQVRGSEATDRSTRYSAAESRRRVITVRYASAVASAPIGSNEARISRSSSSLS